MLQNVAALTERLKQFQSFCHDFTTKLADPSLQIQLKLNKKSEQFASLFSNSNNQTRVKIAYEFQRQIRTFLKKFTLDRFKKLCHSNIQQFNFIDQICDIWQNFQRFIAALKFYGRQTENIFKGFHRVANRYQGVLLNQQKMDNSDKNYRNQVSNIPVMAVNQLKQFLSFENLTKPLQANFVKIFCGFMKQQRQGINTPQEKINQVLGFFESIHLDYECDVVKRNQKFKIVKFVSQDIPATRRSTADAYFDRTFTNFIFNDCENYYKNWVQTKGLLVQAPQQIKQIINYLDKQQSRAKFYIHDPRNESKYINIVQQNLIEYKLELRLKKSSGLKQFLEVYELGKPQIVQQINNFWKIYKRIYSKDRSDAKDIILKIYQNYLKTQAQNVSQSADKASQFIEQSIKLNKKNIQIVKMLGGMLEFDRIRVDIFENLLAMKYVKNQKIKYYFGAKHWAAYLHNKLKSKYSKTQKYNESDADLLNLFKLIIYKNAVIQEHHKLLNQRLVEDLDMSLQAHYANAMELQQKVLDQLKRQSSQNDVKSIQGCLKDIQNSFDLRLKLKSMPEMKPYNFFNQIIRKSGNFWPDTPKYQILPPIVLKDCITTIRQKLRQQNLVFQLQNGTSLFTSKIKNVEYKFQLKNIYLMILLLIDQKPKKKMYFTDIARKQIRPLGGDTGGKAQLELIRALVELTEFKLLKCSRTFSQANPNLQAWSSTDQFSINDAFVPAKKLQIYKILTLPEYLKKAFMQRFSVIDIDQKKFQRNRRLIVLGRCVKLLKHAQTLNGGQGTITFDELLKGQARQTNVDAKYLKQIIQHLINTQLCVRVEDKKNTFRYKS